MRQHIKKLTFIAIITLMFSSCIPSTPAPVIENTASGSVTPTTIILEQTPVRVETSTPTESIIIASPISADNISELSESGRAFHTNPQDLVWSLEGRTFAVISTRQVVVFDAQKLTTTAAFYIEEPVQLLDFSSDAKTAAVTKDLMSLDLHDITTNAPFRTFDIPEMVYDAAFSPDGSIIAIALFDEIAVALWDVSSGNFITRLTGFETAAPVYSISFSSDGLSIIWHARGGVQLQNITTGQMGPPFDHEDFVSGVAVSPDGRILATGAAGTLNGSFTPLVTLWDTLSGQEKNQLATETVANCLAFSPNSRLLAGGVMNNLIIWDATTGTEVFAEEIAADSITSLSFSPDGSTLAATAADNSILLWQVTP